MSDPRPQGFRLGALRVTLPFGSVDLRWAEWGPADGAPVVCVHGLTRTGRDFDTLARELAEDGRRVICPDIPGRGLSSWLPDGNLYTVPTYLMVLQPLLQAMGQFDWLGTSMGGLIGLGLASLPGHGLRRLVLNDVGAEIPAAALAGIGAYLGAVQEFDDLAGLEAHLRAIHAGFGDLSPAEWRHLAETSARMTPAGKVALHYDPAIGVPMRRGPMADVAMWPLWEALDLPVLLLRGGREPLADGRHGGADGIQAWCHPGHHPGLRPCPGPDGAGADGGGPRLPAGLALGQPPALQHVRPTQAFRHGVTGRAR